MAKIQHVSLRTEPLPDFDFLFSRFKLLTMKYALALLALIFSGMGVAQVDMDLFKGMNMREIGPGAMSGRVTSIDAVTDDPRIIYVGTASGGMWKSESGGLTWEPIFDDQPVMSIGSVHINQNNPSEVWAGTGEGNPRNSHTSGAGIFKSINAGRDWTRMGLENTRCIHRVIVHGENDDVVYAGAMGSAWGPNPERGVFRSQDGGQTWKNILFVNDSTGCADLVADPSNPNKLFAAMWEFGRKPWTFNSGGEGSGLYVSHDGGDTWVKRTEDDGLPKGNLGRIGLAVSHSNPNIVYALIEAKEHTLYKSTDGGFTWGKVYKEGPAGNRPFYYADIRVNPKDPKEVWSLWSMVSRSDDGGKTFTTVIPYSGVHPDHHALYIHPENPDLMINGNDGGLNISRDGGENWEFVSNLPLGQFYHINHDMEVPYNIYGGMQDNGSWKAPAYVWHSGGIRNEDWQEISFGDGFDVVPLDSDPNMAYSMYQEGNVMRVNLETGETQTIKPVHPDGKKLLFNWNAAIAHDPFNGNGVYFGSQYLHHSPDRGSTWKIISPVLANEDSVKQELSVNSGGLTMDVTGAENHNTLLCIAPSPVEQGVIWVGTDDGNLQLTRNGGELWDNVIGRIKDAPRGAWIPQIEVSKKNGGEAFVVINDYRRNNWEPYVFHTTDYGKKWTRLVDGNDVTGHCLSIVQDPVEPNLLFLGTENGLYVSFDYGATWNHWTHDFPNVSTMDLKIHPRDHDLIIGTFGRAAYILDDISPLRETAASNGDLLDRSLDILSATTSYQVSYKRPRGARFPGDHHWRGENRNRGNIVTLFARTDGEGNVPTIGKDDKKEGKEGDGMKGGKGDKKDKIKAWVLTLEGDTIRHMESELDTTGVHRLVWWGDTNGPNYPSRQKRKKDALPRGGGLSAEPGKYNMVFDWKGEKDSIQVAVEADPRRPWDPAVRAEQQARFDRWSAAVDKADRGFEALKKARTNIKRVKSQFTLVEDSLKKEMITMADSISGLISDIEKRYMLPKGTKGYHNESELLSTFMWQASSHVFTGTEMPSSNGIHAIEQFETRVEDIVTDINAMFDGIWKEWRAEVEAMDQPLFDDFEKLD